MKLSFSLSGNQFDCTIGHSLMISAMNSLKKNRHEAFRATMAILGEQGPAVDTKESAIALLQDHVRNQIPDDQEVKIWLQTFEGQKFALIHGTQKMPLKLTEDTADQVLDEMSEDDHNRFVSAISDLCFGSQMAELNRQSENESLELAKLQLERLRSNVAGFKKEAETEKATISAPGEGTPKPPEAQT
mgnify:FL=1